MQITVSTNHRLSDLRPKIMRELYGDHTVYLFGPQCYGQPGDVYHLLHGVTDWSLVPNSFGHQVAYFLPHDLRPGWFVERMIGANERISIKQLLSLIWKGEVCALGKDCWKHK